MTDAPKRIALEFEDNTIYPFKTASGLEKWEFEGYSDVSDYIPKAIADELANALATCRTLADHIVHKEYGTSAEDIHDTATAALAKYKEGSVK